MPGFYTFRHLSKVNESYGQHLRVAWGLGLRAGLASVILFVHGLWPDAFARKGGEYVESLNDDLKGRDRKSASGPTQ